MVNGEGVAAGRIAWVESIPETEAEGELAAAYRLYRERMGHLSNVAIALGLKPRLLPRWVQFQMAVSFGASSLGRRREELIHVLISSLNGSTYSETAHRSFLRAVVGPEAAGEIIPRLCNREMREQLVAGGSLSDQDVAMLRFAHRLTVSPSMTRQDDVEALRHAGFSDENVVDIVLQVAYRNFMNRVTSGLGVAVDERYRDGDTTGDATRVPPQD